MRIRSDGAITGMVGLGPLWTWAPDQARPVMVGVNGGAACWHRDKLWAVLSEPPVGVVEFGANGAYRVVDARLPDNLLSEGGHWLASSSVPRKAWGHVNGVTWAVDGLSVLALSAEGDYALAGEASNFQHRIHWASGVITTLPYGASVSRIRDGYAMVRQNNRVSVYSQLGEMPIETIPGESWPIMPLVIRGKLWLLYVHATEGVVLHPFHNATNGTRLAGDRYGLDVLVRKDDLLLAWATQEGDRAEAARRSTLLISDLLKDDLRPVQRVVPPAVSSVPFAGTFFTAADTPGNLSVWVRGPLPTTQAIVCAPELVDQVPSERLAGLWVAHERLADGREILLPERIAESRPMAEWLKVPMWVYDDQRTYRTAEIAAWCGTTPWVAMPQWYITALDDPQTFAATVAAQARAFAVPYCPVVRCYTGSGAVPIAQVLAGLNALAPEVYGALGWTLFAWTRADGITGVPELQTVAQTWLTVPTTLVPTQARSWAASLFPKVSVPMKLPTDVWARVQRFAEAYPPPQGDPGEAHEERCRVWTRCLCEQIRSECGPEWGWKRASATRPPSKETLARQAGGTLEGWDLLTGASTGHPTLSADPGYHDLVAEGNQVFIPVSAVNRLGRPSTRPALPTWVGVSAFDLGARLEAGDRRWLYGYAAGFGVLRVMVARLSGPTPRTLAQGRDQLTLVLAALRQTKQQASVVLCCDTKGMSREILTDHVRQCNAIMTAYTDCIAAVEIGNENWYTQYQSSDLVDIDFMESLDALIDRRFPVAWGGDYEGGSFVTFHSDRGTTPEDNGVIMRVREEASGKDYVDDEPLGIAEPDRVAGRQRTADPEYARRLAVAAKVNGLGGVTLHTDAGLTCDMDDVGAVHLEARRRFLAEFSTVVTPPVPPVPPTSHPILDAPLTPAYPVGYQFWIQQRQALEREAAAWYQRAWSRVPADADIAHGLWRALNEGERWQTARAAFEETWPGGAPR
jgi:hypothetical protein